MIAGAIPTGLVIRSARPEDLAAVLVIEHASFSSSLWTAEAFAGHTYRVAELDGDIAGFLVSQEVFPGDENAAPEREILNIAVDPRHRRRQIASALLKQELERKAVFFLEVRESNLAAQMLYRKFGFVQIGIRKNYYDHPSESALVMQMKKC